MSKKRKIRWLKILANAGTAFFTSLAGTFTLDAMLNIEVPVEAYIIAGLVPAAILFGLAFFSELAQEEEKSNPTTQIRKKVSNVLDCLVFC